MNLNCSFEHVLFATQLLYLPILWPNSLVVNTSNFFNKLIEESALEGRIITYAYNMMSTRRAKKLLDKGIEIF
jgi:hypothetical protein